MAASVSHSYDSESRFRFARSPLARLAVALCVGFLVMVGCIDRPVAPATPETTNVIVDQVPFARIERIDLLFMIDNSRSMADKQALLREAVPQLVERLVDPQCVMKGPPRVTQRAVGDTCPDGFEREFKPILDIHIGIVTSSLGGHGGDTCLPKTADDMQDDRAHLIGKLRAGAGAGYQNLGFLAWDPKGKKAPPGEADLNALLASFEQQVSAVDENGCGFEASLESWYRFLIQPDPPARVRVEGGDALVEGLDEELLAQRRAFLRPDSLVAIIMLTDENDCSIVDGGPGWYASRWEGGKHLWRGTTACATDPNSTCCRPCAAGEANGPPAGCAPLASDPECAKGDLDDLGDAINLRCFDQKRRFGIDFLYPISRYVEGLKNFQVPDRTGALVANPLYADLTGSGVAVRHPSLVFLAGIVGVPWQDVATPETVGDPSSLEYLKAAEIPWGLILGDPASGRAPGDPLMIETVDPRPANVVHPITNQPVAPPSAPSPSANAINGHEYSSPKRDDLQYACTYRLDIPRDCSVPGTNCDCGDPSQSRDKPLCQDPATGAYGSTQFFAKGYPGIRHLQVLKELGENAIVASICPKIPDGDPGAPAFGYNPAVRAIADALARKLGGLCLPRKLEIQPDGTVPCAVVEAVRTPATGSCGDCEALGARKFPDPRVAAAVRKRLAAVGRCDGTSGVTCDSLCLCQILPAGTESDHDCSSIDTPLEACECEENPNAAGFCYVDPDQGIGNRALVDGCSEVSKRLLRVVGTDVTPTPQPGATVFMACLGAELQ